MKKLSLFLLSSLLVLGLNAQEVENETDESTDNKEKTETQFISGNSDAPSTGFGGPWIQLGFINGNAVPFFGGGGAGYFNNRFYFGGFGMGLMNAATVDNQYIKPNTLPASGDLELGMGGMILGYTPWAEKLAHPIFGLDFAWGGYTITDQVTGIMFDEGGFANITPRAGIEINATPWLKVHAAGGYRWFTGIQSPFMDNSALNSGLVELRLHFGWFGE